MNPSPRIFQPSSLFFGFLFAVASLCLSGCNWHGVLKQNTAVGWGGRAIAVAVDPTNDNFVLAASPTGGLFQSAVGGSAWSHVDALPEFGLADVQFSPDHPNVIVATAIQDTKTINGGGIWISTDHGKTWTHPTSSVATDASGAPQSHSAFGISFVPGTFKVFVGTDFGLAESNDLGTTWTYVNPLTPPSSATIFSVIGLSNGRVITYGNAGIRMSDNGVDHWYQDNQSTTFLAPIARALAVSPLNPNDVFETGDFQTLLYSKDGGHNWATIATAPKPTSAIRQPTLKISGEPGSNSFFDLYWAQATGVNAKRVHQISSGLDFSSAWTVLPIAHSDPTDLAFSKRTALLYAANDGGVEKSTDGGKTWSKAGTAANAYDALQVYDVKVVLSPTSVSQNDVYFGTQDNDIFGSGDNGQTWPGLAVPEGGRFQGPVSKGGSPYTQVMFVDQGPERTGPLLSNGKYIQFPFPSPMGVIDPPYYVRDNTFFVFDQNASQTSVFVSTDGANNWSTLADVTFQQTVNRFAVVSGPPANPSVIIAITFGNATELVRVDNAFNGVPNDETVTPIPLPTALGLGSYGFQWLPDILSFGVDPTDPNFIILPDVVNKTIVMTTDGGVTWTQRDDLVALITDNGKFQFSMFSTNRPNFELSSAQVSAIQFDPLNPQRILIGTAEAGIVYSSDHGATWKKVVGSERIPNITSFAFIQSTTLEAYASSWGRGLWTISLDIVPTRSPHGSGSPAPQSRRIRGDAEEARRKFADVSSPRLLIRNTSRGLLPGVIAGGEPITLEGANWKPGAEVVVVLDQHSPLPLSARIDSAGRFSVTLKPIIVPGRHQVVVSQRNNTASPLNASLGFTIVSVDSPQDNHRR